MSRAVTIAAGFWLLLVVVAFLLACALVMRFFEVAPWAQVAVLAVLSLKYALIVSGAWDKLEKARAA